jgi:cytochrome c oxidase subunit 2
VRHVHAGAIVTVGGLNPFTPHSPQSAAIASLFEDTLGICGAVFLLVTVLVVWCVIRFGARAGADPVQVEGHTRLEIAWTIAPILVLIGLLFLTVGAMNASDPPVDRDPDVTIIGHQWWWEARYPSGVVTANEIHIPTGKSLVFRLESADVTHDFWVPELGRKMDATPGRPTSIWLEADDPGTYVGTCAEYCGVQHAWMRILVVAEPPDAFAAWERHELAPAAPASGELATRGAALLGSMSCVGCHRVGGASSNEAVANAVADSKGARFAPDLTHLAERATLGAGVLANNPTNLALWLKDPQAIKTGCHMPNAQLSEAQTAELVAYFETLK